MAAMHTILTAETTYAVTYPKAGYACTLSDLDGFGGGEPNERQAMLINSGLASGKRYGFVFSLSGCSGAPATNFHLSVVPNSNTFGRKSFCADQSGTIRTGGGWESGNLLRWRECGEVDSVETHFFTTEDTGKHRVRLLSDRPGQAVGFRAYVDSSCYLQRFQINRRDIVVGTAGYEYA